MGAHNKHECFDCRHGRSQHSGSQSWALTIYISVLSAGMGAHNLGVPRNGQGLSVLLVLALATYEILLFSPLTTGAVLLVSV